MLVVGYPAGAILAACGQPPGDFGVVHGDKALIAAGVGTLGDEPHRAGAVQADDAEEREGVVGGDAGAGGGVPSRSRVLLQKPPRGRAARSCPGRARWKAARTPAVIAHLPSGWRERLRRHRREPQALRYPTAQPAAHLRGS